MCVVSDLCAVSFAAKSNGETIVPSARILRRFHSRARINTNEFNTHARTQPNFEEIHRMVKEVVARISKLDEFKIKKTIELFIILCRDEYIFDYKKF